MVKPWKRIEPTEITQIDRRQVVLKTFVAPATGHVKKFATWLREGDRSAGVVALTKDKKVIVVRQFRQGPEFMADEIPGGGVEAGEDPEAGTRRELLEETGYVPGTLVYLGVNSRDAYTNGKYHYFLATDCELSPQGQDLDEDEEVEVRLISIDEFIDNAKNDRMTDPAAVLMAYDKLKQIQQEG